ncbi:MAG: cell division protein SepF [Acidimicrobiales bacterium]
MFKKTMLYLGLGPDEEYDFDASGEFGLDSESGSNRMSSTTPGPDTPASIPGPTVRAVPMTVAGEADGVAPALRRVAPMAQPARVGGSPAVRALPIPNTSKPSTVAPTSFNDAQEVADHFKASQAVIVNLQNVERDLSRRIIDFASGLCYGLGGQMERVAKDVYLLTPDEVEVAEDDRRRLTEG